MLIKHHSERFLRVELESVMDMVIFLVRGNALCYVTFHIYSGSVILHEWPRPKNGRKTIIYVHSGRD